MIKAVYVGGPRDGEFVVVNDIASIELARGPSPAEVWEAKREIEAQVNLRRGHYLMERASDGLPVCDVEADGTAFVRYLWQGWE